MDINQVRFGNYALGSAGTSARRSDEKPEEEIDKQPKSEVSQKASVSNDVLNAMNIAGMQNMAQVNFAPKKEIDPLEYNTPEQTARIEAMMAGFDSGVSAIADVIEGEFPNTFDEAQKNALAAQIYAQG